MASRFGGNGWDTPSLSIPTAMSFPPWTMNWDDSPADVTIRSESISTVKDAIWKLPYDLRTAVLLYEYEGLLYEGVSAVLRCRVKPVEMKLYRASLSRSSLR